MEENNDYVVSVFKDAFTPEPVNVSVLELLGYIKDGRWKQNIEYLRGLSKEDYNKEKVKLPAVTFSGVFNKRLDKEIAFYSSLLIIDIDHLDDSFVDTLKLAISEDKHTFACFISPSGQGLKVVFKLNNTDPNQHKLYFKAAQKHFEENYAVQIDKSGKNIGRLCFVSWDQSLILNPTSIPFDCPESVRMFDQSQFVPTRKLKNAHKTVTSQQALETSIKFVEKHLSYSEGSRNTFLHSLACCMNRCGVDMEETIAIFLVQFDLDENEIKALVKSAYFHNKNEFGTFIIKPYEAPDYSITLTDSAPVNDVIEVITKISTNSVDQILLEKIICRYIESLKNDSFYINVPNTLELITETQKAIQQTKAEVVNEKAFHVNNMSQMGDIYADSAVRKGNLNLHLRFFDDHDTISQDCFYGVIGMPRTYKSVFVTHIATENAKHDVPVLYLNGEMSNGQFFERLSVKEMDIDWKAPQYKAKLADKAFIGGIGDNINAILKNNLFVATMKDFTEESICATVDKIEFETGKKIGIIIIDGVSQMSWLGREEINAAIFNTGVIKEIAKKTHTAILGLMHTAGGCEKYYRGTSDYARGGQKTVSNMDGMFMTSLIVHPDTNELINNDIVYYHDKFFLRFEDKRGNTGVLDAIVSVNNQMKLSFLDKETGKYELKINKK